ncbi:DNA helicase (DNA repair), Rad3 type [Cordyceps fumosorosea ARSEF 2679]|uniref:ATP-dependent DNA helicase CHL1 n=1 Tax=Cordyceps fumosorosea (strain ARSEF 2679) TaxID=1081104 RepID=A0A168EEC8_CORFA|nr:DNA helicase (DNA repair), Rad3 type [Cordyceps fumosorosea ARSEF 2679]OAA73713.1 DNA helicase (DNA repair), Rad3 type [Cordyceps fumosorosea ARSEF 2679]
MQSIEDGIVKVDFHHPFTPYDVQEQFMRTVYQVLESGQGQVGILESPTGTGKSLSLICASLTWLRNHKSSAYQTALEEAKSSFKDEPDWMVDQLLRRKREELVRTWEDREKRLEDARLKEKAREERVRKKRKFEAVVAARKAGEEDDGEEWMLDDWDGETVTASAPKDALSGLSKESRDVLERMGLGGPEQQNDDGDALKEEIKIYYTSRTHSQLSQFITELRRPTFPASLPEDLHGGGAKAQDEAVKLLPLSSRQKLCINPSVSRLKSVQAINDRCAELQRPKSGRKCDFVPREELLAQTHEFRDTALATIPDIEDLHQLGKSLQVCPYYASRTALPGAEIVTLPYPLLLQKSARDALGIKLEGNVVIVDEAHNIMDAVSNVYAADMKLSDLRRCREMLGVYVRRFGKKLKGVNRVNVGRVGRVVEGLSEYMNTTLNAKLAYKIEGYASHVDSKQEDGKQHAPKSSTPVLHTFVSFLIALTNLSSEGRIFYQKLRGAQADVQLSYLLLSPTYAFSSIASSARAVILAGGTMSPFDDYKDHLFPTLDDSKITTLSCGHVIPSTNLCVRTLAASRAGGPSFEFSYQRRGDQEMIALLGLAILNMCSIVPDGVVVFFPSYGYLDEVVEAWKKKRPGDTQPTWERLQSKKTIFQETKGASSDEVLQKYSEAILGPPGSRAGSGGALLLSVVGGKMSEGINFSDRLGRLVVIIGLPYPNIASPDWKAKMEYIESSTKARLLERGGGITPAEAAARAKQTARDFYENSCMRAVNQSIGRAIRHRGDYAAIVLLDKRYTGEGIRSKLPGWIQGGLQMDSQERGLGGIMGALGSFFRGKKTGN